MEETNWLAIAVATLIPLIVGFAWYNPKLFGNAWMQTLGYTEEDLKGANMAIIFGVSLVLAFFLAMFLAFYVKHGEAEFHTFKHGAFHGLLLGLMVGMPVLATNALFERRSFKYILINVGYWLVCMTLAGGILSMWR
jgi:hypothetical protein